MKGILLAAGLGTRLKPLTYVFNKTSIPVYNKPMFFYSLKTLIDSGINDIVIVSNQKTKNQLRTLLKHFDTNKKVKIRFAIQKRQKGMVDAILSAKKLIGKSKIAVFLADNICTGNYAKETEKFNVGAMAFLTKVNDPSRSGCPFYSKDGTLIKIVEKPPHPQSNTIVTAPYFFDNQTFELAKLLKPSKRGELEITDLLNLYLENNQLNLVKNKGKWFDTGTFDSLLSTSIYVSKNKKKFFPNG